MILYINIAQLILGVLLIAAIVLQSKKAGLGGLSGADSGGVYRARRGVEKVLFNLTILIAILFFGLAIATVIFIK